MKPRPIMTCGIKKCPHPEHIRENQGVHGAFVVIYSPASERFHVFDGDNKCVLRTKHYTRVHNFTQEKPQ